MLTTVDVECDSPFYMSVLGANPRDSLILQSITGLGPPDKTLFMGEYSRDGDYYGGRRVLVRNSVLTIQINPNYALGETTSGLRRLLYKAFNDPLVDSDEVKLILHDDEEPDKFLIGYTEKFEGEPFGQDTTVTVSMTCPDPYIRDVSKTIVTPPSGLIGWQTVPFIYAGDAETGFETTILVQAATSKITLENNGSKMVLNLSNFIDGDIIYINTLPGQRAVRLTRAGVTTDVLYILDPTSPWLTLHSQQNSLRVYGAFETDVVAAVTNLTFTQSYWGI